MSKIPFSKPHPAIGDMLNAYRRIWACPAKTLARTIGISVPTLYRIEAGKMPDGNTLVKLFQFLFKNPYPFSSERGMK